MSIDIHDLGVIGMMLMIALNMLVLLRAKEATAYVRKMRIYITPASASMIGVVVFTGIVMMAAKHLDFTLENIAMIIASVYLIVLEVKRTGLIKWTNTRTEEGFALYKTSAIKILWIELAVIAVISVWMLII